MKKAAESSEIARILLVIVAIVIMIGILVLAARSFL